MTIRQNKKKMMIFTNFESFLIKIVKSNSNNKIKSISASNNGIGSFLL